MLSQNEVRTSWRTELLTLTPLVVVVLGGLEYAARSGASHADLIGGSLAILLTQTLPGALLWRAARPRAGHLVEDLALGSAVGAAVAVPAQVLTVLTGTSLADALLCWVVAGVLLAVPATRRRIRDAAWVPLPLWWGTVVAVGLLAVLTASTEVFDQVLPGRARWTTQYIDVPYHLALIGEVQHNFPPHTPQVASERLDYHWFSHAWLAQIGTLGHAPNDIVMLRLAPVVAAALCLVALACVGNRLAGSPIAGAVTGLLATLLGTLPLYLPWGISVLYTSLTPSTGFALLLGCPLVVLLAWRWRGEVPAATVALVGFLALASGGSKGSWLPVLLLGCLVASAVVVLTKGALRGRVLLDTGLVAMSLVLVYKFLFRGNEGGMHTTFLDSLADTRGQVIAPIPAAGWSTGQTVAVTVLMVLVVLLPMIVILVLGRSRESVRDPALWLLLGTGAAGLGALLVFTHPGLSQFYFFRSAFPFLAVAVGWGIARAVQDRRALVAAAIGTLLGYVVMGPLRDRLLPFDTLGIAHAAGRLALLVGVLVLAGALVRLAGVKRAVVLVVVFGMLGAGLVNGVRAVFRTPFHSVPLAAGPHINGSVRAGQVKAMTWIADHAGDDDLVMTNRHCRDLVERCQARRFWLAAYGGHRVLVESWGYTRRNNEDSKAHPGVVPSALPFWDPALLRLNDDFYTHPSVAAARKLYDLGVRWVYAERSTPFSEQLGSVAHEVYETKAAVVYRLEKPA